MRYDIHYATNDQLWSMENAAEKAGYKKTEDCYWVQIFTNGENYIVTTREDAAAIIGDPVKHFNALLTVTEDPAAEKPATEQLTNIHGETATVEETANGAVVTLESGRSKTFSTYDKAIDTLYFMGYRF